ncbi:AB-hydrolase-associated lipase region [Cordyceps fumosorosea ARSEF 2679]|uniref:AB-hydrolase-associated lipase region n=1 Tax=Cordyceps fumosorosea (strain ARSEF 2679) TaxID=1081104 RepID=A0A162LJC0_CORFA|nr:AB-hydrolase-associated lipase region [Cordyceps fumosorosea ARSEF 2679]OAA71324.1 AB-hydrolase-associated lipase region [Cordyceps fumosorosea ARSEF 2679]
MVAAERAPVVTIPPLVPNCAVKERLSLRSSLASVQLQDAGRINAKDDQGGGNIDKEQQQTGQDDANSLHITSLFATLPNYGPPTAARKLHYLFLKMTSFVLSLLFLLSIVLASMITSIPSFIHKAFYTCTFRNYDKRRIFYEEEQHRADTRRAKERSWKRRMSCGDGSVDQEDLAQRYQPTEGGRDPIISEVAYYARRVGLDVEKIKVKTEDGFLIDLWHVYDPSEYTRAEEATATDRRRVFQASKMRRKDPNAKCKAPVLLLHGLLQSAGAFCCGDDDSLAFWLCKAGYDVWLGNNRCGLEPRHEVLRPDDPRMWCWNLTQMGVFDLAALVDRVLLDTGFPKLGLVCHSQGTAQTFVALAREQRPELGAKISVFCALAPAAYAGPLIRNAYFRFVRMLPTALFRVVFGVHAFIPLMMRMHGLVPPRLYGRLGYAVFSYLFGWTDGRWDRGLRDRFFQFAPVYVSAETMRWWLGGDGFAKHGCVLATRETVRGEDRVDREDAREAAAGGIVRAKTEEELQLWRRYGRGATAWYDERVPPMALWVCEKDDLVDGKRLLRRFGNGREPQVKLVHSKVISGYEHLDVLWAMDAVDQVFVEVRDVLWKTWPSRDECVVPDGCEGVPAWQPAVPQS